MIEVIIRVADAPNVPALARITIENVSEPNSQLADYSVRFGVDKLDAVGLHQRGVYSFPRTRYNVLALLRQAMLTLDPQDLELHGEVPDTPVAPPRLRWRGRIF